MIETKYKASFEEKAAPFVVKAVEQRQGPLDASDDCALYNVAPDGRFEFESKHGTFSFKQGLPDALNGDVLLCLPSVGIVERLFRANSKNNTFLFTERCDQMCLMCSQPPRNTNDEWRFPLYEQALGLVPNGARVGISGGEPTLYKEELFGLLESASETRPDISFHILSNCQHFEHSDLERLSLLNKNLDILWGIPLYGPNPAVHEKIVDKVGAFNRLIENLYLLAGAGGNIELRTVLTQQNVMELPDLAVFLSKHLPFVSVWAIMAMEPIGFAKANKDGLFFDHSVAPYPLNKALDICEIKGIVCRLYNFPICTVDESYRKYCEKSISDWKRKYLKECEACMVRSECTGFFEWYTESWEWSNVHAIL